MALSNDLIAQFVKTTKDTTTTKNESTVYGTVVEIAGEKYVAIDGSDLRTPVSSTADVKNGDRVTVMIKDHSATITGNISSPSVSKDTVDKVVSQQVNEFDIILSDQITTEDLDAVNATIDNLRALTAKFENMEAVNAEIESLRAKYADLTYVNAEDIKAINATIENIEAMFGDFDHISAEDMEAVNAEIQQLKGYSADFTYVSAEILKAIKAEVDQMNVKYANIDFANIGEAAFKKLFADTGILEKVVISNGQVTGELVGVTIRGDRIIGDTIVADKLVIKGEDGLYYKLNTANETTLDETITEEQLQNGLSGKIIIAKSITAEKVAVDDLVAFGATIGGINIKDGCMYSGTKESVGNTTDGFYLDRDGQIAVGNSSSYLKFFKDTVTDVEGNPVIDVDGNPVTAYKLAIAADNFIFASTGQTVDEGIDNISNNASDLTNQAIETSKAHTDDALKNYVDSKTFQDYQNSVGVLIQKLDWGLQIAVGQNDKIKEDVDKNASDIKDAQDNLARYFDFKKDGLTIRAGDNSTSLTLDSDDISFSKASKESGTWDGDDFYTRNVIIKPDEEGNTYKLQLGTFAFMPRKNGSLSFGKVGG